MKNTKQVENKLHQIVLGTKLGNIKNLRCMVQCENFISDSEKFSMISLFFYMAFLFVFNFETFFLALSWYITALFTRFLKSLFFILYHIYVFVCIKILH
jgi:hypothetical protein